MTEKTKNRGENSGTQRKYIMITAAGLIAIVIIAVSMIGFIGNVKNNDTGDTETETEMIKIIPDFSSALDSEKNYKDIHDFLDSPLEYIRESEAYARDIRIVQAYGDETDGARYTVYRNGENIKAVSGFQIITKNEDKLCIDQGVQTAICEADFSKFYETLGITSLEMIREMYADTENFDTEIILSENHTMLTVNIDERFGGMKMYFEIDVENGLVVTERFYFNETPYRSVATEQIYDFSETADDFFAISDR